MMRRPNRKTYHAAPGVWLKFTADEIGILKHNIPGPGGLGGYQGMENILVAGTDRTSLRCYLTPRLFERLVRYVNSYGPGGPNDRIRRACRPALARLNLTVSDAKDDTW